METQFNIDITSYKPSTGRVTLTTDLAGLEALSANTTREYSAYFHAAYARLSEPVAGEVVEDNQPPLPGL